MKIDIGAAGLRHDPEEGYVGNVRFRVEGHPQEYEITLFSKKGKEWEYGLHFAAESGSEERIDEVEAFLEEDDVAFDALIQAALDAENKG
ncbi:hypothetical protein FE782_02345 [Paenibacillus antri]|uniref:Uncharacterized protein n=1 Tax=Paenibacillus antri TaxID=2582848 RepID=A0A5R9GPH6_9BACL|nr:hypothetical protein [Paenibacillus antri]TLS54205.1 hypothetical protein FE782_02345 [Paenibacillus antri]